MYRKYAMGQYQIEKGNEASTRIREAIVALLQEERLPSKVSERAQAIAARGKLSQATLYKEHNISLWHPRYTSLEDIDITSSRFSAPPMSNSIQIPAPRFELYEFVTLHWNGFEYPTRIVEASFRLGAHEWVYQVAQVSNELDEARFFNESVLEARTAPQGAGIVATDEG